MSRTIQLFNLFGIVALVLLCCVQWEQDRQLHLRLLSAEQRNDEQANKIVEEDKSIKDYIFDLDDFRARLAAANAEAKTGDDKLTAMAADRDRINAERNQFKAAYDALKSTIDKWTAAVAARDEALKKAGILAQQLSAERNEAVAKFNDLVAKYNAAADEIKRAADEIQKLAADRNDAVAKFNELANKYNALIGARNAASQP